MLFASVIPTEAPQECVCCETAKREVEGSRESLSAYAASRRSPLALSHGNLGSETSFANKSVKGSQTRRQQSRENSLTHHGRGRFLGDLSTPRQRFWWWDTCVVALRSR
jgi:hypothetical protein